MTNKTSMQRFDHPKQPPVSETEVKYMVIIVFFEKYMYKQFSQTLLANITPPPLPPRATQSQHLIRF